MLILPVLINNKVRYDMCTYNEYELEQMYDEFLDECYPTVNVCGYDFDPSRALKELDPTAYRCGFVDWCDQEGYDLD